MFLKREFDDYQFQILPLISQNKRTFFHLLENLKEKTKETERKIEELQKEIAKKNLISFIENAEVPLCLTKAIDGSIKISNVENCVHSANKDEIKLENSTNFSLNFESSNHHRSVEK